MLVEDNKTPDAKPLIEHLKELKLRVTICLLSLLIGSSVSYIFVEEIYSFLVSPLSELVDPEKGRRMIYTGLAEAFITYLKLSIFSGFIFSFPIISWQVYSFVAPGLYKNEKSFLLPFLFFSPVLFIIGAAFVYYFLFPLAWEFFISFETLGEKGDLPIQLEARVSEYLSIVMSLIIAFGLTFQLPIIIFVLVKIGAVSVETLIKFRKYSVVIILILAAILTPPDIISQIALALPLFLLYELSIILSKILIKESKNA